MKYKIGDKIQNIDFYSDRYLQFAIVYSTYPMVKVRYDNGYSGESDEPEKYYKLIETTMDLKEKFLLAFKAEPEKTFRKAGITNGDDFLTEDGQKIFLSWLLKKNGDDFKKEVVDNLLAEEK